MEIDDVLQGVTSAGLECTAMGANVDAEMCKSPPLFGALLSFFSLEPVGSQLFENKINVILYWKLSLLQRLGYISLASLLDQFFGMLSGWECI